jgi:acetolactate synthase-1/2/3 large subunit
MGTVTGGRLVVDALKKEGVEYIFSLSGGHINPIYQACLDTGIKVIDTRHEQAAAHMAEAWGKLTRKPGVCVVTAGPGFTNAITGVANARASNTPMIVIAGRSGLAETEKLALQELEQIDIIRPLIKWGRVVYEPHRLYEFTAMAFRHAMTGRPGPVFLEIPTDIMHKQVEEKDAVRPEGYRPKFQPGSSKDGVTQALEMLRQAKKPAIIAGSGAYFSGADEELKKFVELTDIPVFTSLMGRGLLSDNDPQCFGLPMMGGADIMQNADVIMVLGSRLGLYLGYGQAPLFPADAKMIQVDIEGSEIGRNRKIDLGLVGDIKEVLKDMIELFDVSPFSHKDYLDSISTPARDSRQNIRNLSVASGKLNQARIMKEINEFLDPDAVVVADGGDTFVATLMGADVSLPGHFLAYGDFGCLGVGIPFGLAAKLRHPDKQVLVTMGDGSAGINLMEFHTAVRFNLPIVMVVFNDQAWGMIRNSQKVYGPDRIVGCELGEVSYEKVVEALGGYGERVDKADDIKPALKRAFASGKPACINVYTDPVD